MFNCFLIKSSKIFESAIMSFLHQAGVSGVWIALLKAIFEPFLVAIMS